jgi:hypothetical protein
LRQRDNRFEVPGAVAMPPKRLFLLGLLFAAGAAHASIEATKKVIEVKRRSPSGIHPHEYPDIGLVVQFVVFLSPFQLFLQRHSQPYAAAVTCPTRKIRYESVLLISVNTPARAVSKNNTALFDILITKMSLYNNVLD